MTFEQTPFDLKDSIFSMLELFDIKIREKNLEFIKKYDENIPQIVLGDSMRLRQIMLNLLSNAVKFTNEGKITVQISLLEEDEVNLKIEFTVTDTGIGIPQDKLEDVFKIFEQANRNTVHFYGGTGLGLSIVKQLVEAQGGTIQLESKPNKGTKFSFTLPFKKNGEIQETEPEVGALEMKNVSVLVAEDVALNQLLIKIILLDFGFEVEVVENGKIALEKLKQKYYDIILMDLQMPEMDGFETTIYIRKEMNSQIPIIALTADVTTVDFEKCLAIGMNDYISKPIDEKLLYSKIVNVLKKSENMN